MRLREGERADAAERGVPVAFITHGFDTVELPNAELDRFATIPVGHCAGPLFPRFRCRNASDRASTAPQSGRRVAWSVHQGAWLRHPPNGENRK